jgi:hypothetical protein
MWTIGVAQWLGGLRRAMVKFSNVMPKEEWFLFVPVRCDRDLANRDDGWSNWYPAY